jgi:hypothetical protein
LIATESNAGRITQLSEAVEIDNAEGTSLGNKWLRMPRFFQEFCKMATNATLIDLEVYGPLA